jgi:hypothetical protein
VTESKGRRRGGLRTRYGAGDGIKGERDEWAARNPRRPKRARLFCGTASRGRRLLQLCWGKGEEDEGDERKEAAFQKPPRPLSKRRQGVIYSLFCVSIEHPGVS